MFLCSVPLSIQQICIDPEPMCRAELYQELSQPVLLYYNSLLRQVLLCVMDTQHTAQTTCSWGLCDKYRTTLITCIMLYRLHTTRSKFSWRTS